MPTHTFTVNTEDYSPAECEENDFCVKVPRTSGDRKKLKYGHAEDDNVDIAYLNFPLLRASFIFTFISITAFITAVCASFQTNYTPITEDELVDNSIIIIYGSQIFRCRSSLKYPADGLFSILNLVELNVWGNVIFRLATCLTIAIRCFHSIVFRNLIISRFWRDLPNPKFKWLCDLLPMVTLIETTALAMFSIITMHSDFKAVNHFCKSIFGIVAVVGMSIPTVFYFILTINSLKTTEVTTVFVRAMCTTVFAYCAPQYFHFHLTWTKESLCHSLIPRHFAIMEYSIILAYVTFHLLALKDLQGLQFICYPRSCSGECEPLEPKNFEKGKKYEHCRAFEYNQWRLKNSYK